MKGELEETLLVIERQKMLVLEHKIVTFLLRTKLKLNEVTIVYYKDKSFPQWIGAVSLIAKITFNEDSE